MGLEKQLKDGVLFVGYGKANKKVLKVLKAGDWIWYVVKIINRKKVPFIYEAWVHGNADEFGASDIREIMAMGAVELPLNEIPVEVPNQSSF